MVFIFILILIETGTRMVIIVDQGGHMFIEYKRVYDEVTNENGNWTVESYVCDFIYCHDYGCGVDHGFCFCFSCG